MESEARAWADQPSEEVPNGCVVCGLDDSPAALMAARVAWLLGSVLRRPLALAHVRRAKEPQRAAIGIFSRARDALAAESATGSGDREIAEWLLEGQPCRRLVDQTARPSTELLVVGAPRSGRLRAALRRGTVRHLVANARCPVVVVPAQLAFREALLTRAPLIVASIDGTFTSWRAASVATRIVRASGGSLLLAHVFHWSMVIGFRSTPDTSHRHRRAVAADRAARERALRRMERGFGSIVPTEARILEGDPRNAIPELVGASAARLLAVGSRGRGARASAILGSVSMALATTVGVPTLIVGPGALTDAERSAESQYQGDLDSPNVPAPWSQTGDDRLGGPESSLFSPAR